MGIAGNLKKAVPRGAFRNINPVLLATFVAIGDTGSFTAAADRVGRSVAAVSMQMQRLQDCFPSTPLFEEEGRGRRLTAAGQMLLSQARLILNLNDEVWSLMEADRDEIIRIGTPDDYAGTLLPRALREFLAANPRIGIDVVCEPSESLSRLVQRNELDLALVTRQPGDVLSQTLRREPFVWVTSTPYSPATDAPISLALFQPGCVARSMALAAFADAQRPYRIAYSCPSTAGLIPFVRENGAVAVMAKCAVPPDFRILGEADGFPPLRTLDIALMQGDSSRRTPSVRRLAEALRASLSTEDTRRAPSMAEL